MPTLSRRVLAAILLLLVASSAVAAPAVPASAPRAATVDPALGAALLDLSPGGLLPVIVTVQSGVDPLDVLLPLAPEARAAPRLPIAGALLDEGAVATLAKDGRVRSLWLDRPIRWDLAESVPLVGAPLVWETFGSTGRGVTVAVFDTGIDTQHPDLTSRVANTVRAFGITYDQPNFVEAPVMTDVNIHGTHVAGIIAGTGAASDRTYRGVAPGARLLAVAALDSAVPTIFHAITSYGWILENQEQYGIRVVANSWGMDQGGHPLPENPVNVATLALYEAGLVVVFSAGNDGPNPNTMGTIKNVPWVISVAAGTKSRGLISFSSRGVPGDALLEPDVTAPGYLIYAARALSPTAVSPLGAVANEKNPAYTPFYWALSGTSMASPHVSGAVALMLEANPDLSPDQVIDIVKQSADPMVNATTGETMPAWEVGSGYLNVTRAYLMGVNATGEREAFASGAAPHRHGLDALLALLPAPAGDALAQDVFEGTGSGTHFFTVPAGANTMALKLTRADEAQTFQVNVYGPDGKKAFDFGAFFPGPVAYTSPVFAAGEYEIDLLGDEMAGYTLEVAALSATTGQGILPLASGEAPSLDVPAPGFGLLALALVAALVLARRK